MRIVSLLASGTELICALGAGDQLVGRSHECDDPAWVTRLPALSHPTFDVTGSSGEIDRLVRERLRAGQPLYQVDTQSLRALAPDLVITQTHCDVCAVGPDQLAEAHTLPGLQGLRTVSMRGGSLDGILRDFQIVADAIGRAERGRTLIARLNETRAQFQQATSALPRPRVVCLEWIDPPFPMGNWGPELVELAGGSCALGTPNAHSVATPWQAVVDARPEVLIVAGCGFTLERTWNEMSTLTSRPGWTDLPAVRDGRVYVSDGNRYFNRSGPAVFETIGLLAEMLHPQTFPPRHEGSVWRRWPTSPR